MHNHIHNINVYWTLIISLNFHTYEKFKHYSIMSVFVHVLLTSYENNLI